MTTAASIEAGSDGDALSLIKLRKQFNSYASVKDPEIMEARQSWRYYHNKQWTKEELRKLRMRKQPEITLGVIQRKADGIVGTIRRLRTDPKAFPRTEKEGPGAEVATQAIRYVCDSSHWEEIEAEACRDGVVGGINVAELEIVSGDQGDPDIAIRHVDPRTYFYDPRSTKPDFSDARFMGTYKWCSMDELEEIFPGAGEKIASGDNDGGVATSYDQDRDQLWTDDRDRVRLVDHWYIKGGQWQWCLHVGTKLLDSGVSPFVDDHGKTQCKYEACSNNVDDDGDRYGYVRVWKGGQDVVNHAHSKGLHIANTRQVWIEDNALPEDGDVEKLRREAAKPDGVVVLPTGTLSNGGLKIETGDSEFLKQQWFFDGAMNFITNYGPNAALIGDMPKSASGRAIALQQQAGLAELGPFLKNFRAWKLNIYRKVWFAIRKYWQAERWLRVTDDDKVTGFLGINQLAVDPNTGQPVVQNALSAIDVDILLDEGPDTETVMGDTNDMLMALAQNGVPVPPEAIIETSGLPSSQKDKLIGIIQQSQQPDPMAEQAKQLELAQNAANVDKTHSETVKNLATADKTQAETGLTHVNAAGADMQNQQAFANPASANDMHAPERAAPQPQQAPQGGPQPIAIHMPPPPELQNMPQVFQSLAEAMGQVGQGLQAIAQTQQAIQSEAQQTAQALMSAITAPTEAIRDQKTGRVIGGRKVLQGA
jgi:hypothetical protein